MTEDRKRQTWIRGFFVTKTFIWILCGLLIGTAVGVPLFIHHVATRWSEMMSDFAALWSVTDVLQAHVLAEEEWPEIGKLCVKL
jgi:cytochrome bd-type quinol oxidase subunit 2